MADFLLIGNAATDPFMTRAGCSTTFRQHLQVSVTSRGPREPHSLPARTARARQWQQVSASPPRAPARSVQQPRGGVPDRTSGYGRDGEWRRALLRPSHLRPPRGRSVAPRRGVDRHGRYGEGVACVITARTGQRRPTRCHGSACFFPSRDSILRGLCWAATGGARGSGRPCEGSPRAGATSLRPATGPLMRTGIRVDRCRDEPSSVSPPR
jgi:hypothetical protein